MTVSNERVFYWASDLHLDFLSNQDLNEFYRKIDGLAYYERNHERLTYMLLSGDIGVYKTTKNHLGRLADSFHIYYSAGNHDYYGTSHPTILSASYDLACLNYLSGRRNEFHNLSHTFKSDCNKYLRWGKSGLAEKQDYVYLVGLPSFGDGVFSKKFKGNPITLNDFYHIGFLKNAFEPDRKTLHFCLNSITKQCIHKLSLIKTKIHRNYWWDCIGDITLIILSHTPLFVENSLYQGNTSPPESLPYFVNRKIGAYIKNHLIKALNGLRVPFRIVILSGHTHNKSEFSIPSIEEFPFFKGLYSFTPDAEYGKPHLAGRIIINPVGNPETKFVHEWENPSWFNGG